MSFIEDENEETLVLFENKGDSQSVVPQRSYYTRNGEIMERRRHNSPVRKILFFVKELIVSCGLGPMLGVHDEYHYHEL